MSEGFRSIPGLLIERRLSFFMLDYAYKAKILKTDLCKRINKIDKMTYLNSLDGVIQDYDLDSAYFDLLNEYDYKDIKEARKINKATYQRIKRLKDKITQYIEEKPCIWATLTFSDEVLANTNPETRRQYVRRFLKSHSACYLANIDYGSKNEREHYHALMVVDKVPRGSWSYGFDKYKRVRVNQKSSAVRISKYISKLTNHAIKETTKSCYIIYSR